MKSFLSICLLAASATAKMKEYQNTVGYEERLAEEEDLAVPGDGSRDQEKPNDSKYRKEPLGFRPFLFSKSTCTERKIGWTGVFS